jgi:hypothetical protein
MVEKNKRPDHAAALPRQQAAHGEAADIGFAAGDGEFDEAHGFVYSIGGTP